MLRKTYETIWLFEFYEIDNVQSDADVQKFHESKVEGESREENVAIPCQVDQQVNFLGPVGNFFRSKSLFETYLALND